MVIYILYEKPFSMVRKRLLTENLPGLPTYRQNNWKKGISLYAPSLKQDPSSFCFYVYI